MRLELKYSLVLLILFSCHTRASESLAVSGQSAEVIEEELIVSSLRLPATTLEAGSSVAVITAADITARGYTFALDAITSAAGVTTNQNGAYGGTGSVRIRGAASEQTLVLIDGMVVNDPTSPGGGFNFATLDVADIERIEILKGPHSTLWGTDAIGGVVSVITKIPTAGFGLSTFVEGGSHNTFRGGAGVSGANELGDFRIAATIIDTSGISDADEHDGNREEDGYEALNLASRMGFNFSTQSRLEASIRYTDAEKEFDSFGLATGVQDGDERTETTELSATLRYTGEALDGRVRNDIQLGYADIDRDNFSAGAPSFSSAGKRLVYRYQGTVEFNDAVRGAFGAERDDSEANGTDTQIDGYFALLELNPLAELTVSLGGRVDDHEVYGSETTGRIALVYKPLEALALRASWGQGFKAPTIFQTTFFCCGALAPNSALKPETSDGFDLGFEYYFSAQSSSVALNYFEQDIEELITFSFAVGSYENIAVAQTRGFELVVRHTFAEAFELALDYAYIEAEDRAGERLVRIPKHSTDIALSWSPGPGISTTLSARYNDEESGSFGSTADWWRVDVSAVYSISAKLEFYGRLENLFDEEYQQVFGYGTPGLSALVGFRYRR